MGKKRATFSSRSQDRKADRIIAQKTAEGRNRRLRQNGEPTPYETAKAQSTARRMARIDAAKAANTYKPPTFNERGFIVDVVDGHTVLRDPDNWAKRRKARFAAVASGRAETTV